MPVEGGLTRRDANMCEEVLRGSYQATSTSSINSVQFKTVWRVGPCLNPDSTIWPGMDPAHSLPPETRLGHIEGVLQYHEAQIDTTAAEARQAAEANEHLFAVIAEQLQLLTARLPPLATPATPAPADVFVNPPAPLLDGPEPCVGAPERYDGDPETCNAFLTNCSLLFALQPRTFATEAARVAFVITHLSGRARLWGTAEWERQAPACSSFSNFAAELQKVFGQDSAGHFSTQGLLSLRQASRSVADYSIEFRTLASRSSWNPDALRDTFLHGLADYIKDALVSHDLPQTLDGAIELAIRVDLWVQARRRDRRRGSLMRQEGAGPDSSPGPSLGVSGTEPELMQLGRTALTPEERLRRRRTNLCLYCGGPGHFISACPVKSQGSPVAGGIRVSPTTLSPQPHRPLLHARLLLPDGAHTLAVLVD